MKHVAAYALLVLGGNAAPSADDINKVLKDAGVKGDTEAVDKLVAAVKGAGDKGFHEIIAEGLSAIGACGPAAGAAVASAPAEKAEEKAAVVEEEEDEVDMDMGGLFGGDEY